jgi:hypothetical protein
MAQQQRQPVVEGIVPQFATASGAPQLFLQHQHIVWKDAWQSDTGQGSSML